MTLRKRLIYAVLLVMLVGIPVAALRSSAFRLRGTDEEIAQRVRQDIPLGTPIDAARKKFAANGWRIEGEWPQKSPIPRYGTRLGSYVVHVNLGSYWAVFTTDVDAFFGFDQRGVLVDVFVRKMVDAL